MENNIIYFCVTIFGLSLWKVYLGAVISNLVGLNYCVMLLLNLSAVVSSSFATILFQKGIFSFFSSSKKHGFSSRLKRILRFWKMYGYWGGALLAPILMGVPVYIIIGARLKESMLTLLFAVITTSTFWLTIFYFIVDFWDITVYLNLDNYLSN